MRLTWWTVPECFPSGVSPFTVGRTLAITFLQKGEFIFMAHRPERKNGLDFSAASPDSASLAVADAFVTLPNENTLFDFSEASPDSSTRFADGATLSPLNAKFHVLGCGLCQRQPFYGPAFPRVNRVRLEWRLQCLGGVISFRESEAESQPRLLLVCFVNGCSPGRARACSA
jgi:hypothetical protein